MERILVEVDAWFSAWWVKCWWDPELELELAVEGSEVRGGDDLPLPKVFE